MTTTAFDDHLAACNEELEAIRDDNHSMMLATLTAAIRRPAEVKS